MAEIFIWEDFLSDLMADLLHRQDIEELAKLLGKSANYVSCFIYRSKAQNLPNLRQLATILEYVNRSRPEQVQRFFKQLGVRFGVVAGSRGEVLRQIAGELERPERRDPGVVKQFRFPREEAQGGDQ